MTQIRPATEADRPSLIEQFQALNAHEDLISHDRRVDVAAAEESLARAEARVARSGGTMLVAERDGRVVGHMFLTYEEHAIFVRPETRTYGYVAELFVREEARRQGIGRRLLEEAERLVAARGIPHLIIGVLAGNEAAERTYARFGFAAYAHELIKPVALPTS
jgi:GNAT superfamily N-acetyltransferase